jgi:hypothetical protein
MPRSQDFLARNQGTCVAVPAACHTLLPGSPRRLPHPSCCLLPPAAALLGVDQAALLQALATRTRQTVEGPIRSPLDVKAAGENRDSLSKIIYAKMFDWLVTRVNMAIGEDT